MYCGGCYVFAEILKVLSKYVLKLWIVAFSWILPIGGIIEEQSMRGIGYVVLGL